MIMIQTFETSSSERPERPLKVIVLAAGKGSRLQSEQHDLPKVLRQAAGRPLLAWVADNLSFAKPADIIMVVGFQAEKVKEAMGGEYRYVLQTEQLGTGHAVMAAADELAEYDGDILAVYGDMPLFESQTYTDLIARHQRSGADCTLLTAHTETLLSYGRILRDDSGRFSGIVEQKDCTPEQLAIREVNPGVYVFRAKPLFSMLGQLGNDNQQGEYYLTDVPKLMQAAGLTLETHLIEDEQQILGVNTEEDLAFCTAVLQQRQS